MSRRTVRLALIAVGVVVVGLVALSVVRLTLAARAGSRGQHALQAAVSLMTPKNGLAGLSADRLEQVRAKLAEARADFAEVRDQLGGAGPAYTAARYIPFIRVQVRGIDELSYAGTQLAASAVSLVDTADRFLSPADGERSLAKGDVLGELRQIQRSAADASEALRLATNHLAELNGYRLVGPLGSARATLVERLPTLQARANSARDALDAFIAFAGGDAPKRYLVLSQNPDEVRPTGGYMGSYGVMTANDGHLHVARYGDTNVWIDAHPKAVIPEEKAPIIFRVAGSDQTLGNVNWIPDFPRAAQLATDLWRKGGEQPVDGVVSFTPEFLARMVKVLGPIHVPIYGDTVTGDNLVARTDYWTHHAPSQPLPGGDKEYLSVLAPLVMNKLVTAPSTEWPKLATALADGFSSQQAMVWVHDQPVQDVFDAHRWSFQLPEGEGDFFADAEFEFMAKNGRDLHRTFDHSVELHADGSATVTTTMSITDADPVYDRYNNPGVSGWFTPYGPAGGELTNAADTPDSQAEPDLQGHPTSGWQLFAKPGGTATLKLVWDVPQLLLPRGDDRWDYALTWIPTPSHSGDVAHIRVTLPDGWEWVGQAPPSTLRVDKITDGHWLLQKKQ